MMGERRHHLAQVFTLLKDNDLYVKKTKCEFSQEDILFLGHKVGNGAIRPNPTKLKVIEDWEAPKTIHDVRSYHDLDSYYRNFIDAFSSIEAPLTELTKKDRTWSWMAKCKKDSEILK